MKKIMIIGQPRCCPVYNDLTGKLMGWQLAYDISDNQTELRYFMNSLFSNGYKKMCRFQTKYLKQRNENTK
jgi:hypothetical protein